MKRRNKIVESEIIRPEPITDEALSVLESIKQYTDDMRERERIQERIDNLNVSPLQQRINKIRKIADEAKERIDEMEDRGPWFRRPIRPDFKDVRLGNIGVQYKPIAHKGTPTFEVEEIRPKYDYQKKIYPGFMTKEEFLRPPSEPITSIDLSRISGEAKEIRVDSNADITSIVLPGSDKEEE